MASKLSQSVPGRNGSDGGQADQLDERRTLKNANGLALAGAKAVLTALSIGWDNCILLALPGFVNRGLCAPAPRCDQIPVVLDLL